MPPNGGDSRLSGSLETGRCGPLVAAITATLLQPYGLTGFMHAFCKGASHCGDQVHAKRPLDNSTRDSHEGTAQDKPNCG